jgi:hypothetical protein
VDLLALAAHRQDRRSIPTPKIDLAWWLGEECVRACELQSVFRVESDVTLKDRACALTDGPVDERAVGRDDGFYQHFVD